MTKSNEVSPAASCAAQSIPSIRWQMGAHRECAGAGSPATRIRGAAERRQAGTALGSAGNMMGKAPWPLR